MSGPLFGKALGARLSGTWWDEDGIYRNSITGQEVGKAVQENAVKAGSLDGPWGRIAEIVSSAAVTGIQELFGVGEKQSSRADLPPVPPLPDLPRVPGRAPPPPR